MLPWTTVMLAGPVMLGAMLPAETANVMLLVTMPALLLATSEYVPLSATCALTMDKLLLEFFGMLHEAMGSVRPTALHGFPPGRPR